ncbi:MAG TPA: GNAT family N-acetyltransferase [Thermoanaerobaculia bacterium]
MAEQLKITNNEEASRFETTVEGAVAYASYDLEDGRIVFTHTIVPSELAGRGIANQLAKAGLDHARSKGLGVVPQCSFIAKYIERNPEWKELVTTSE